MKRSRFPKFDKIAKHHNFKKKSILGLAVNFSILHRIISSIDIKFLYQPLHIFYFILEYLHISGSTDFNYIKIFFSLSQEQYINY